MMFASNASVPLANDTHGDIEKNDLDLRQSGYKTTDGRPWEVLPSWTPEDLQQRLEREVESVRELMKSSQAQAKPIARSPFAAAPTALAFKDMSFSVSLPHGEQKTILEPTSGCYEAGDLVAIMGPSGCGKSTLLDMLANKKTAKYDGTVLVNGQPRDGLFQRIASYVGQEDVMPEYWRVREAVRFNLTLKRPRAKAVPESYHEGMLDVLLECFGLSQVQNSYIGGPSLRGISGGQRRRVTLARGVAAGASLLFCDEPTSGLSATDAELCVRSLRVMAKRFGTLIMVVIHQPRVEVAALFDQLLLLTSNPGRAVYAGSMQGAMGYWAQLGFPVPTQANPTDFYLDLATPGTATDQVEALLKGFEAQKPSLMERVDAAFLSKGPTARLMLQADFDRDQAALTQPVRHDGSRFAASSVGQLNLLLQRKIRLTLRSPMALGLPIAMPVAQGVLMGLMYQDIGSKAFSQQLPFVFMQLANLSMIGMQLIPALIQERTYMKYDSMEALYSEGAYLLATALVDVPLCLLGAVLNIIVMYTFSGMAWEYFSVIFFWAVLLFFVFDSLYGCITAVASNGHVAQVMSLPFVMIFMMFSGFMVSKAAAPSYLRWFFDISPTSYAMQAIVMKMAPDYGAEGQQVVKQFGFVDGQNTRGIFVMLALIVVFRFGQIVAMRYLNNIQK